MRRMVMVLVSLSLALSLAAAPVTAAPESAPPAAGYATCHVVRYGETLFSIGRLYRVNPWAIASYNHLANPNHIYAGQCLRIPPANTGCYQCGCSYTGGCGYTGSCGYGRCGVTARTCCGTVYRGY